MIRINDEYKTGMYQLMMDGKCVQPRGMVCFELLNRELVVDMKQPLITLPGRKLSYKFALAEAVWILSGRNDVEFMSRYNNHITQFSDNGEIFNGAYGPRINRQMNYALGQMINDRDTRQSVISIWDENPPPTKDYPCTLIMQFVIREDRLHSITTMRSNDFFLGTPYDILNFSSVAALFLLKLKERGIEDLELGNLYLNAGSRHVYKRNVDQINEVLKSNDELFQYAPLDIHEFDTSEEFLNHLKLLLDKKPVSHKWLSEIWNRNLEK